MKIYHKKNFASGIAAVIAGIVSLLQLQRQPQASELFCGNAGAVDRQLYGQKGICPAKRKSYGFLPAGKAMYNTVFHQRLQKQL